MCNSAPFLDDYHEVFRTEFIIELYGLYPNSLHLDPTFFSQEKIHHYGTYAASNSFETSACWWSIIQLSQLSYVRKYPAFAEATSENFGQPS